MKGLKGFFFVLISLVLVGSVPTTALAADDEQVPFAMEAVLPENQRSDSGATYYDLIVKPETKQELQFVVKNASNKEIDLKLAANGAVTNSIGTIDYGQPDYKKDSSAKYTLNELLKVPSEVKLAAGESKSITAELTIPKDGFNGVILGGIQAVEADKESTADSSSKSGLQLSSKYAMVIGVLLTEDPENQPQPELKLNDVKAGLDNGVTAVLANLQNVQPAMVGKMTITGTVYKKGSSDVFKKTEKKNQEMAPNSNFDFAIDWQNEPLQAGDYTLKLVAQNKSHKWEFSKDFTITGEEEQTLNEKAVGIKKDYTWLWILLGALLFIALLILAFLLGKRRSKDEEEEK